MGVGSRACTERLLYARVGSKKAPFGMNLMTVAQSGGRAGGRIALTDASSKHFNDPRAQHSVSNWADCTQASFCAKLTEAFFEKTMSGRGCAANLECALRAVTVLQASDKLLNAWP